MKEVAKRAKVSKAAVSQVLNNRETMVSQETRERILTAARELNYRPNYFARALKMKKTQCIGLMGSLGLANFNVRYFSDVTAGIENAMASQKSNYSLLIFGAHGSESMEKNIELINKGLVDGLLLIIVSDQIQLFEKKLLPAIQDVKIPFVVIQTHSKKLQYNNVGFDLVKAGYLGAKHLLGNGRTDIRYYTVPHHNPEQQADIMEGIKQAHKEQGLEWDKDKDKILRHSWKDHNWALNVNSYLTIRDMTEIPDAILAFSNNAAAGIVRAVKEKGLRVPEDISVIGINNALPVQEHEWEFPTVYNPITEKTAAAVRILNEILEGKRGIDTIHSEVMEPRLVPQRKA
jgi:LacI family transcriptional regulator